MRRSFPLGAAVLVLAALLTAHAVTPAAAAPVAEPVAPPAWTAQPARIVVIGDSVAGSAADALQSEAARRGVRLDVYARAGCGITSGIPVGTNSAGCVANNPAFFAAATAEPTSAVVVMSSWEVNNHIVGGKRLRFRSRKWDAWMSGQLDAVRRRFGGVPLLLTTVAPRAPVDGALSTTPAETALALLYNEFLVDYAAARADSTGVVDLVGILCPTGAVACPERIDGVRVRPDLGAHFDAEGGAWFAPRALDAIEQAWDGVGTVRASPAGG